jgi:hypothetical protein
MMRKPFQRVKLSFRFRFFYFFAHTQAAQQGNRAGRNSIATYLVTRKILPVKQQYIIAFLGQHGGRRRARWPRARYNDISLLAHFSPFFKMGHLFSAARC